MTHNLLTVEHIAAIFHVTPFTVRRWYREGKINGIKIGWRLLFEQSEVERLIREHSNQPEPEAEAVEVTVKK